MITNNGVIHLVSSIGLGGAEQVVCNLFLNSNISNHQLIEIFSTNSNSALNLKKELAKKNIKISTCSNFGKKSGLFLGIIILFFKTIGNQKIIHSHTDLPDFILATVIKIRKIIGQQKLKVVRTIHNTVMWPKHPKIGYYVESAFNSDQIIAVSNSALNAYNNLRSSYGLNSSVNQKVIFNSVQIEKSQYFDIKDSTKINVVFCGRLEHQKGVDILIDLVNAMVNSFNNMFNFYIIGEGSQKPMILDFIKGRDEIFYYTQVDKFSNIVHHFDYILIPSRFEGFGLVSIESSLSGVLPIISSTDALKETLPLNWRLIFDLDDPSEIVKIFQKIFTNEIDIEQLKNDAYYFSNSRFKIENMIADYKSVYAQFEI